MDDQETRRTRRECISSIMAILQNSPAGDRKTNLRKVKRELQFKASDSAAKVMKSLAGILLSIDNEMRQSSCPRKPHVPVPKQLVTRGATRKDPRRGRPGEAARAKGPAGGRRGAAVCRGSPAPTMLTRLNLEGKQLEGLRQLRMDPEVEGRPHHSRQQFFAALGLRPTV
jgi:hypothetical protein